MTKQQKRRARRSAEEWRREVAAWKRSGETAEAYAEARDLSASTLKGWSFRLRGELGAAPEPRLVQVDVAEPAEASWELRTASGHELRVHGALTADMVQVVLTALTSESRRRRG